MDVERDCDKTFAIFILKFNSQVNERVTRLSYVIHLPRKQLLNRF